MFGECRFAPCFQRALRQLPIGLKLADQIATSPVGLMRGLLQGFMGLCAVVLKMFRQAMTAFSARTRGQQNASHGSSRRPDQQSCQERAAMPF